MSIVNYIREDLRSIVPYSSARSEFNGTADVWLDANENPLVTEWNRYPDPLQRKLKDYLSGLKGIPAEQLFLGNGSDEVLDLIFRLAGVPYGDTVAFFDPSYGMYDVLAKLNGLNVKRIPLDRQFHADWKALANELEDVKLFVVCRPNNPTGNLFALSELETVLQSFKGVMVVDEAYIDFCPEASMAALTTRYPNLIVVQTLSKAYGMAGLRIGMAIANPQWIHALNSIKPPYNISTPVQEVAMQLLAQTDWTAIRQTIVSERERLLQFFRKQPFVREVFPSQANFILIRVDHANGLYDHFADLGVVVRNRSNQYNCENTLRITVGTEAENNRLMNAYNTYQL